MATRAKDPKIVNEAQNVFGFIKKVGFWVAGVVAVLVIGTWIYLTINEKPAKADPVARTPPSSPDPRTTRVSALKVLVPTSGTITIRVDEGPGTCDPQGRVKVTTSAGESFEDGPNLTIRRGKVPVGTKEEYRSLEGSPVQMTCFNRTLL